MATKIYSCSFKGLECQIIEVEADIGNGLPTFNIVGLGDTSVQESKERVRLSIKNSGMEFPLTRKTINLAPAELRKQGSLFDLPIAVSILLASKQIPITEIKNSIIIGELSLDGRIKKIHGALPLTQAAKEQGFHRIFLPQVNAKEAAFIEGIEVFPLDNLKQLIAFCQGSIQLHIQKPTRIHRIPKTNNNFTNLIGLEMAKRALSIAAVGGHNVLLSGSPGCGKTVISRAFKSILPAMNKQEIIETSKIFSIAGLLDQDMPFVIERPFRELHHTASISSVIGGGNNPKPGEISLAHNGVVFFDEIAEFPKQLLETLRQPLEDKFINISRSKFSLKFPSNFSLIATMNPCPCGYHGDKKIKCICSSHQIKNYQKKLSGPLLDRFDIFLEITKSPVKDLFNKTTPSNQDLHSQIESARALQSKRGVKNSDLSIKQIKEFCQLDQKSKQVLNKAEKTLNLSTRAYFKLLKLARSIADLEQSPQIQLHHLTEAIQYRKA